MWSLSVWRKASLVLLGYQILVAVATIVLAAWLVISGLGCAPGPACVAGGLIAALGFVWIGQALVAGVVAAVLFRLTLAWSSQGAAIVTIILEGLGLFPAMAFLNVLEPFGVPGPGLYAFGAVVAAAIWLVLLGVLELFVSDIGLAPHRLILLAALVVIPFAGAAVPGLSSAYASAQIGPDGFPVGAVTAEFVEAHGSKLPLRYPGSKITYTSATAESKMLNRYRMASWDERMAKNGLKADEQAWYQRSLGDAGWRQIFCKPGGCQDDFMMVFVKGSRECVSVLVTNDGVGEIDIDYQITPSAKPLSGDPTADHRFCTGQY
jgi:hypothetical protein